RHRAHREHRDQPASSRGDHGDPAHSPHDGALRPPRPRRHPGGGARGADRGTHRHDARAPGGVSGEREHAAERDAVPRSAPRAAPARTILLVLRATAGVLFVIACSNVANLILARTVRREGELAVRAALGASTGALRRTLLAESLLLCAAGAVLGVMLAHPLVDAIGRYAARFSVRALDAKVDASLLWVGAGLAMVAAVGLAYAPRRPSPQAPTGLALASGGVRIPPGTTRRVRAFAIPQIAFSFVLLAGAATLLASLTALQTARTSYNLRQVLAVDVSTPLVS